MKKVTMLLLLVIVASTLLMAAAPLKLVRVWTINKSGHTIYMKLEGVKEENFYYLESCIITGCLRCEECQEIRQTIGRA